MAVTTVIERDASSGSFGIWNEDANGNIILTGGPVGVGDGFILLRLADSKGHTIKLRELCVDVDQPDGSTKKMTIIALCSEPY